MCAEKKAQKIQKHREKTRIYEAVKKILRMVPQDGKFYSIGVICEITGLSYGTVRRYLRVIALIRDDPRTIEFGMGSTGASMMKISPFAVSTKEVGEQYLSKLEEDLG